jgi:hypothetical protein
MEDLQADDAEMHRGLRQVEQGGEELLRAVLALDDDEPAPTVGEYLAEQLAGLIPAEAEERIAAIREGFSDMAPLESIRRFVSPEDLQSWIVRDTEISVDDLMASTRYDGSIFTAASPQIGWFWNWLRRSSNEVRRYFLSFLTVHTRPGPRYNLFIRGSSRYTQGVVFHTSTSTLELPVCRSATELESALDAMFGTDAQFSLHH